MAAAHYLHCLLRAALGKVDPGEIVVDRNQMAVGHQELLKATKGWVIVLPPE
jgi:hypothetical protein